MAEHDHAQVSSLFPHGVVPMLSAPLPYFVQLSSHPFGDSLELHDESSAVRFGSVEYKSQEFERGRFFPLPSGVIFGESTKLNESGFFGMKGEPESSESLRKYSIEFLRIVSILKTHYEIVAEAVECYLSSHPWFHCVLYPLVEHDVQVEVSQDWTNHRPLVNAIFGVKLPSLFHDAHVEPFADYPQ